MFLSTLLQELPLVFDEFPYIVTRVVTGFYHVLPLPPSLSRTELLATAIEQANANRLPTCIVFGQCDCLFIAEDGNKVPSILPPRGGRIVCRGILPPCNIIYDEKMFAVLDRLQTKVEAQIERGDNTIQFGDLTKGNREASPEDLSRLADPCDSIPTGLTRCTACNEYRGECLDPSPNFKGTVATVHCRCANDNRCVRCGELFSDRKLNTNVYRADRTIWHHPGFPALTHRCQSINM